MTEKSFVNARKKPATPTIGRGSDSTRRTKKNPKLFRVWDYVTNVTRKPIEVSAPIKPGVYEFRLYVSGVVVAVSNPITINGADSVKVEVLPDKKLNITSKIVTSEDPYADSVWIGLFSKGDPKHSNWILYAKLRKTETVVEMNCSSKPDGEYELRVFGFGTRVPFYTSAPFELKNV